MMTERWRADTNILAYPIRNTKKKSNLSEDDQSTEDRITLIWCDKFIQNERHEDQHTIAHLQQISRSMIIFTEEKRCLKYIKEFGEIEQLVLIISGSLGEKFIPDIYEQQRIRSIYIFCGDKNKHQIWARKYPKIKGVFNEITKLCDVLTADIQQLENERVGKKIVDFLQESSPVSSNIERSSTMENFKYNHEHQSINNLKKSNESFITALSQDVQINRNPVSSNTINLYTCTQQIDFADTGIWPCISMIASTHDEFVHHLQSAIEIIPMQYFSSIEDFLEHFKKHSIEPHMIVISNPASLDSINRLVHQRVRKLYIHCSNNRLAEYDEWYYRHPQLICVLQYFNSLSRLILWDLSKALIDIGNYYVGQNRNDLAQKRYDCAYRLHITIHGVLNNQRDIIECNQSTRLNEKKELI